MDMFLKQGPGELRLLSTSSDCNDLGLDSNDERFAALFSKDDPGNFKLTSKCVQSVSEACEVLGIDLAQAVRIQLDVAKDKAFGSFLDSSLYGDDQNQVLLVVFRHEKGRWTFRGGKEPVMVAGDIKAAYMVNEVIFGSVFAALFQIPLDCIKSTSIERVCTNASSDDEIKSVVDSLHSLSEDIKRTIFYCNVDASITNISRYTDLKLETIIDFFQVLCTHFKKKGSGKTCQLSEFVLTPVTFDSSMVDKFLCRKHEKDSDGRDDETVKEGLRRFYKGESSLADLLGVIEKVPDLAGTPDTKQEEPTHGRHMHNGVDVDPSGPVSTNL